MPSPFPGVDPYIESPMFWQDFHERFIPYSADCLQPQLPERYRARIDERLVVETTEHILHPDLAVVKHPEWRVAEPAVAYSVAEVDVPVIVEALPEMPHEAFLKIIDRAGEKVVTIVELLSPSNKKPGATREQYLEKQRASIESGTNLVEIDLLHKGLHTVAAPRISLHPLQPVYSLVSVWRAAHPRSFEIYPVRLQNRLPRIRIPLLPKDQDVVLDIQKVFTQCYDNARYDRDIDYTKQPPIELTKEDDRWVDNFLRENGMRS